MAVISRLQTVKIIQNLLALNQKLTNKNKDLKIKIVTLKAKIKESNTVKDII